MKVILGSAGDIQEGWVNTDIDTLDIRSRDDFAKFFGDQKAEAFLAEHVLEHLTEEETRTALANIRAYLPPYGNLRIAVPDGNHPDKEYIDWVRPGGTGPGCDLHKQLFAVSSLLKLLEEAGFRHFLLEWWNEEGKFFDLYSHFTDEDRHGKVYRSYKNDERNADGQAHYTSLIVDAWWSDEQS